MTELKSHLEWARMRSLDTMNSAQQGPVSSSGRAPSSASNTCFQTCSMHKHTVHQTNTSMLDPVSSKQWY